MDKVRCSISWNILHSNLSPITRLVFFEIANRAYCNDKPYAKKMFKSPPDWLINNLKITKDEFENGVMDLVRSKLLEVTNETDNGYKTMGWQINWDNVDNLATPSYITEGKKVKTDNNVLFKKNG